MSTIWSSRTGARTGSHNEDFYQHGLARGRRDNESRLAQVRLRDPWNAPVGRRVQKVQHRPLHPGRRPVPSEPLSPQLVHARRQTKHVGANVSRVGKACKKCVEDTMDFSSLATATGTAMARRRRAKFAFLEYLLYYVFVCVQTRRAVPWSEEARRGSIGLVGDGEGVVISSEEARFRSAGVLFPRCGGGGSGSGLRGGRSCALSSVTEARGGAGVSRGAWIRCCISKDTDTSSTPGFENCRRPPFSAPTTWKHLKRIVRKAEVPETTACTIAIPDTASLFTRKTIARLNCGTSSRNFPATCSDSVNLWILFRPSLSG